MVAPTEGDTSGRRKWFIGGGAAVMVVIAAVVLALVLGKSTPKSPAATSDRTPSTTSQPSGASLVATAQQYESALSTETAANQAWVAASGPIVADETKQNQRLQQDQATYNSNVDGLRCNAADFSTYESCVQQDEQSASSAQNDEAAATAQIQTDYEQYSTNVNTYETAISTFISQVASITTWPSPMTSDVNSLLTSARTLRGDLAQEAAESPSTPQATVSAITAQAGTDVGNFSDAISLIKSDLLHLGASLSQS